MLYRVLDVRLATGEATAAFKQGLRDSWQSTTGWVITGVTQVCIETGANVRDCDTLPADGGNLQRSRTGNQVTLSGRISVANATGTVDTTWNWVVVGSDGTNNIDYFVKAMAAADWGGTFPTLSAGDAIDYTITINCTLSGTALLAAGGYDVAVARLLVDDLLDLSPNPSGLWGQDSAGTWYKYTISAKSVDASNRAYVTGSYTFSADTTIVKYAVEFGASGTSAPAAPYDTVDIADHLIPGGGKDQPTIYYDLS